MPKPSNFFITLRLSQESGVTPPTLATPKRLGAVSITNHFMASSIYKVKFEQPPIAGDGRTEFYFTSLSAIYETLTPAQVGCKVTRLWNIGVSNGQPYIGKLCTITKEQLHSKPQENPSVARLSNN